MMTSLDALILVILVAFCVRGLWTGLVSQLAFLAALVLGFVAAGSFYERLAPQVQEFIGPPQIAFFATFTVLFLLVYLLVVLVGASLKRVVKVSLLGWFDRLMGGLLGLAKGFLLATLLFMALAGLLSHSNVFLRKAYFYPLFTRSSQGVLKLVRDDELREHFRPRDPAITSLLSLQGELARETRDRVLSEQQEKLNELREQLAREARERMR